jgi:DNA-binding MarR family transcriptional regulator
MNTGKKDRIDQSLEKATRQRPDLPLDGAAITLRLLLLGKLVEQRMNTSLADYDMQMWELDVMAALLREGPPYALSAGDLARNTLITCSGMTHRLDRLQQRGLVSRAPSDQDRRQVMVSLTDTGRRLADKTVSIRANDAHELMGVFSEEERCQLETLLRRLLLLLEDAVE